jgi:hypothetical protein
LYSLHGILLFYVSSIPEGRVRSVCDSVFAACSPSELTSSVTSSDVQFLSTLKSGRIRPEVLEALSTLNCRNSS